MTESESVALPLGDAPIQRYYYIPFFCKVKFNFLKKKKILILNKFYDIVTTVMGV